MHTEVKSNPNVQMLKKQLREERAEERAEEGAEDGAEEGAETLWSTSLLSKNMFVLVFRT